MKKIISAQMPLTLDEILVKLSVINSKLSYKNPKIDHKTAVLARAAKVSEEYGEFIDELLSSLGMQRQDKLSNYNPNDLAREFGDVFVTLFLLGMASGIDVKQAIIKRLDEQYDKWSNN